MEENKRRDPIPEYFASIEEASDFWDTRDAGDYEKYLRPVNEGIEMSVAELLQSVQFVTDSGGNKKAILIDIETWGKIVPLLENTEYEATPWEVNQSPESSTKKSASIPPDSLTARFRGFVQSPLNVAELSTAYELDLMGDDE